MCWLPKPIHLPATIHVNPRPTIQLAKPASDRRPVLHGLAFDRLAQQPGAAEVPSRAGVVECIEPVVLPPDPLPLGDDATAGDKLFSVRVCVRKPARYPVWVMYNNAQKCYKDEQQPPVREGHLWSRRQSPAV